MIKGIGIDVVHGERLKKWMNNPRLLERYFHPDELKAALSRGSGAVLSLAVRFAAKEAFGKALGTGLKDIVLKDIMVLNYHNGCPSISLFNTALKALKKSGAEYVHISLTHEKDHAIAMVVLEDGK